MGSPWPSNNVAGGQGPARGPCGGLKGGIAPLRKISKISM